MLFRNTDTHFIAHRGLSGIAPENTAAAFRLAGESGFWGCECDIYETERDERNGGSFDLAISHDASLKRMCGIDDPVRSKTARQLGDIRITGGNGIDVYPDEKICFFGEYADICSEFRMAPVVEIKDTRMSDEAIRRAADILERKSLLGNAMILCFDPNKLNTLRYYCREKYNADPDIYLLAHKYFPVMPVAMKASRNDFSGLSIHAAHMTGRVYRFCRARGLRLNFWNVKDDADILDMITKYRAGSVTCDFCHFDNM